MRRAFYIVLLLTGVITASARSIVPDVRQFREIGRTGSIGVIYAVAIRPDNTQVAIGTSTGLYLYDLATLKQLSNFGFYDLPVDSVVWSPDGRYLAYVGVPGDDGQYLMNESQAGQAIIWDSVKNTQANLTDKPIARVAWSPDGRAIAGVAYDSVSGIDVYQWSFNGGHTLFKRAYTVPEAYSNVAEFDWVGGYFAALLYKGGDTGGLAVWEQDSPHVVYHSTEDELTALAPSPDGKRILLGDRGLAVELLDLQTLQLRKIFDYDPDQFLWSADGQSVLMITDGQIDVLSAATWQKKDHIPLADAEKYPFLEGLSADGKFALGRYVAGDLSTGLALYGLPDWQIQRTATFLPVIATGALPPSLSHEFRARYDDNGRLTVYRSADNALVSEVPLFNAPASGEKSPDHLSPFDWSPDGRHLALMDRFDSDQRTPDLIIVNVADGPESVTTVSRVNPGIMHFDVHWLPDNQHVVINDADASDKLVFLATTANYTGAKVNKVSFKGQARVIDVMSDALLITDDDGLKVVRFDPIHYQTSAPDLLEASPPGTSMTPDIFGAPVAHDQYLILHSSASGNPDITITVWDIRSIGEQGFSLGHPLWKYTYTPYSESPDDFTQLLSGTHLLIVRVNDAYEVVDLDTGSIVGQIPAGEDNLMAYQPQAGLLAMKQRDNIAIWQVMRNGVYPRPLITLHGHTTTWIPDGGEYWGIDDLYWKNGQIISEGGDGTLRTWGVPAGSGTVSGS